MIVNGIKESLNSIIEIMSKIYGKYSGKSYVPKSYKEGKGRYLWTDAYGVCNFITLFHETKEEQYLQ